MIVVWHHGTVMPDNDCRWEGKAWIGTYWLGGFAAIC